MFGLDKVPPCHILLGKASVPGKKRYMQLLFFSSKVCVLRNVLFYPEVGSQVIHSVPCQLSTPASQKEAMHIERMKVTGRRLD